MRHDPLAVYPSRHSPLGMGSLLRNGLALAAALAGPRDSVPGPFARGEGRTVLVIPAFLAGDWATARLRDFLTGLGYRVETAGVAVNLGPTTKLVEKLDAALLQASANGPIAVVGQSLGGVLARDLVRRRPARVRKLVTLCSPIRVPIVTPLAPAARLLERYCDPDWLRRRDLVATPPGVPVVALYSKEDGVVDWRQCLQDETADCTNVEVKGAHATIASHPQALAAIARALSS